MQNGGVQIHESVPDENLLNTLEKPSLVILDDLMTNVSEAYLTALFTKKSHHKNMCVCNVSDSRYISEERKSC